MLFNVVAEIEIDDKPVKNYISISLQQRFNEHHTFFIRILFDVFEQDFTLKNIRNLLGKITIIRFKAGPQKTVVNEFKGIITDVGIEQADAAHSEIFLRGSSPTIMLESGEHAESYLEKDLKTICEDAAKDVKAECKVNINPVYKSKILYMAQYFESFFEFLNRLSVEYGEWFFYDGKQLLFGKPSDHQELDLVLGEDVTGLQHRLQLAPLSSKHFFEVLNGSTRESQFDTTPDKVTPLGPYGKHAGEESEKIFKTVKAPYIRPYATNAEEAKNFMKFLKLAKASKLEVISGTSTNAEIKLGTVATIIISKRNENDFTQVENGKYIITSVNHQILQDGRYYNDFEGVPSALEVIPVRHYKKVKAEIQTAIVKSNDDPKNQNRVKVQMLWQEKNMTTDWIPVMTPDGGIGDKVKENRGFVFLPEVNDLVYINFRYSDPNLPFVMGSLIRGRVAAGGGKDNKVKTISTKKGSIITFDDEKESLEMKDVNGDTVFISKGKIVITSSDEIELKCGDSSIKLKKSGEISMDASKKIVVTAGNKFELSGTEIDLKADAKIAVKAGANLELQGTAGAKLSTSAIAEISGSMVKIN